MCPQAAAAAAKGKLPNWALAGLIGSGVAGVYFYMLNAVGSNLDTQIERESARQAAAEKRAAGR